VHLLTSRHNFFRLTVIFTYVVWDVQGSNIHTDLHRLPALLTPDQKMLALRNRGGNTWIFFLDERSYVNDPQVRRPRGRKCQHVRGSYMTKDRAYSCCGKALHLYSGGTHF
jgi:hypothetical protein